MRQCTQIVLGSLKQDQHSEGLVRVCCRILGENNGNLPKIVQIMAVVLSKGSSLADAETVGKMKVLLTQMQGSLPPQVGIFVTMAAPPYHLLPRNSILLSAAFPLGRYQCMMAE